MQSIPALRGVNLRGVQLIRCQVYNANSELLFIEEDCWLACIRKLYTTIGDMGVVNSTSLTVADQCGTHGYRCCDVGKYIILDINTNQKCEEILHLARLFNLRVKMVIRMRGNLTLTIHRNPVA